MKIMYIFPFKVRYEKYVKYVYIHIYIYIYKTASNATIEVEKPDCKAHIFCIK